MNSWHKYLVLLLFTIVSSSVLADLPAIIPQPITVTPLQGNFTMSNSTVLAIRPYTRETKELASVITAFLSASLGISLATIEGDVASENDVITRDVISIVIDREFAIAPEGYFLSITPDRLVIKASTVTGAFWACQTVRQLMPTRVENHAQGVEKVIAIPCVTITDAPRFSYRGLHLDVARHMFSVEFIKKYIDVMAAYKLNTFHWHLTDDQGWRIEIKGYPKLQQIAAYRNETLVGHNKAVPPVFDGIRYGGYYTQEEIKEVVEYARQRHITIIPEIELPGHCLAALAAYPELGCTGGPYQSATRWGIFDDVYCAGNEKVFAFLEDVLAQVMELFPSTYIHIGGDEVRKQRWKACSKCQERIQSEKLRDEHELQSYFIQRIERFINSKGRTIIGWDEILEGGLAPHATVMSWRGIQGGIQAARLHHQVIMTPCPPLYFDYYQSQSPDEPLAIRGYSTLKDVYEYEPIPQELDAQEARYIIGVQANVWTEYIQTTPHVEYMTYPRAIALAEIAWSRAESKNYDDFVNRLKRNRTHLQAMHVYYARYSDKSRKCGKCECVR